ncbi:sterol 24c-methyltransferase [Thraustotheca clavata]|uniref:Methyltransferase n=1 Tax=Thraustotheca clavata TaxID=74557 RepID=A0A1V9YY29_9STRA|nr:sterol 24c-methyltransferase [Thraustotheca clavata]
MLSVEGLKLFFEQNEQGVATASGIAAGLFALGLLLQSKAVIHMFLPNGGFPLAQIFNWIVATVFFLATVRFSAIQQQINAGTDIVQETNTALIGFAGLVFLLIDFCANVLKGDAKSVVPSIAAASIAFFAAAVSVLRIESSGWTQSVVAAGMVIFATALFGAAKSVANNTTSRDGSDFQTTLLGSTRLLSNPDSVLSRDAVNSRFENYDKLFAGARKEAGAISTEESIKLRQSEYKLMVDSFYDLVTDFYEYGWGQSFHFANRFRDETFRESIRRVEYFLSGKLGLSKGKYALDMGCGIGGPMRNIARFSGAKIKGITINEYQVRVANRNNKQNGLEEQCHVQQGNFMEMPFESSTFDSIYAIESVCHAPDKKACFSEACRVLKPGGVFVGLDWAVLNHYDPKNMHHVELKEGIEVGNGLPTLETPAQIAKALEDAGLEVLEHYSLQDNYRDPREIPWYSTLEGSMTLQGFRMTWLGRQCTHVLVSVLEFLKIAPKGTVKVSLMLNKTADDIVAAGKMDIFTPSYFFMARKPLKPLTK